MRAKLENYAVSLAKSLADQRGRNSKWAELAVRESVAITEREALQENVIDLVAADLDQLIGDLQGRTVTVAGKPVSIPDLKRATRIEHPMTLKQQFVNTLSDPNLAFILGLVGLAALAIELLSPGLIVPGLVGTICLILAATAFSLIPITTGGLLLVLFGVALLIVEMFVPSFGALGIAGIVSLVIGGLYFIDPGEVFSAVHFGIHWGVLVTMIGTFATVLLGFGYVIFSSRNGPDPTGLEGLFGRVGTVTVTFRSSDDAQPPIGRVFVNGELWHAKLEGPSAQPPEVGEKVVVQGSAPGMTLVVRRA
jgi:membrane-bound serine protease (ClpP class)